MKYKIHTYVVCWNEIDILPFAVDYWKLYSEKVIVYDNGSDDGTLEFLSQYPWIEVRHFKSDGLDDTINMNIKNECWKESRRIADYVVVCDLDELLYSPVLESELDYMKQNNITICGPRQYALCGDFLPEHNDTNLLHELVNRVYLQQSNHSFATSGKIMLFDPNKIDDMKFGPGCHTANPTGIVRLYDRDKIFCIHTNKGFGVDYKIKRTRVLQNRLSNNNRKYKYGIHYFDTDERIKTNYMRGINNSVDFSEVLKQTFNNYDRRQ